MQLHNTHIIHKVFVEVNTDSLESGRHFKTNFLEYLKDAMFPLLEQKLEAIATKSSAYSIRLQDVSIDIEVASANDFSQIKEEAIVSVEKNIIKAIEANLLDNDTQNESVLINENTSQKEILQTFLRTGKLPWWTLTDTTKITTLLNTITLEVQLLETKIFRERFIKQFNNDQLVSCLVRAIKTDNTFTEKQKLKVISILNTIYATVIEKISINSEERFLFWDTVILELILNNKQTSNLEKLIQLFALITIENLTTTQLFFIKQFIEEKSKKTSVIKLLLNFHKVKHELLRAFQVHSLIQKGNTIERISNNSKKEHSSIREIILELQKILRTKDKEQIIKLVPVSKKLQEVLGSIVKFSKTHLEKLTKEQRKEVVKLETAVTIVNEENVIQKIASGLELLEKISNQENINTSKIVKKLKETFENFEIKTTTNYTTEITLKVPPPELSEKEKIKINTEISENLTHLKNKLIGSKKSQETLSDTELYVENVGIILVHPFLKYFFKNLELFDEEKKELINPVKAAHLLHYIATKETKAYENNMLFEKILCGIPENQPINRFVDITENEKEEVENMLKSMLSNWTKMESSSIELLRNEFLQRSGKLTIKKGKIHVKVERKPQDILINNINWNISIIKFPWIKNLIQVAW
ncbi:conserved protein of unknown function [Tenacibaculum sp. 190524A02b]|uniref:contractile injection system tape measure protein n=1 Tax=Tenacibaculum vairaonense TaxID=3137860 RepID=UPI0032B1936D